MSENQKQSPASVIIHEITLRDGLQNLKQFIPSEMKIVLLDRLVDAGAVCIESTAFVSPKWVSQMADAEMLCKAANSKNAIRNSVLVPNVKGLLRASACGAKEIVGFLSVSEIHNKQNLNASVQESLSVMKELAAAAIQGGIVPRVNIATAFGYQKDEPITKERVLSLATTLEEYGFAGITLCDTSGVANPNQVFELCTELLATLRHAELAVHFHQSSGIEFANTWAAYSSGIRIFETAACGLGGCPFAPEADGNIATEKVVRMFNRMGIETGIDESKIFEISKFAKEIQVEFH